MNTIFGSLNVLVSCKARPQWRGETEAMCLRASTHLLLTLSPPVPETKKIFVLFCLFFGELWKNSANLRVNRETVQFLPAIDLHLIILPWVKLHLWFSSAKHKKGYFNPHPFTFSVCGFFLSALSFFSHLARRILNKRRVKDRRCKICLA